jgi:crotonobetainyl-CoA:carnitine CoA-transferase CaiB-like acyl-CoA transferase
MGHVVAIPAAGAMLADWGAEVTKIEPLTGEIARGIGRTGAASRVKKYPGGEVHWIFQMLNRNKRGVAVDLKKESGREFLYELVRGADVFMSNYEMSALKTLGLDYASLSKINPRLVYAVLNGYGTTGPDRDQRGFDFSAAWAHSGMQFLIGEPGSPPPPQRGGLMDRVAGAHIVAGVLAALRYRDRTGEGQELDLSLYHTGVWTLATDIQLALMGLPTPKHDRTQARNPLWNTYRTRDDRWLWLSMLQSDLSWPDFCRAIEKPELENDLRFNTMEGREQNSEELVGILDDIFRSRNVEEWEGRLREHNCIYSRVQNPLEVITDPQAIANDFFADINHPIGGEEKLVNTPVRFHQNPASITTPAPEVGQHTEEILLELGYDWDRITDLKEKGVIL